MGNQYYDPRTPSFWSLSVIKKKIKKCTQIQPATHRLNFVHLHPSVRCSKNFLMINQKKKTSVQKRGMGDMIYYDFRSFCYQQLPNDQQKKLTSVQKRGMGDMIYYDFRSFCYQQLPNDQPNILFDICSLHCAAKGVLSSCPKSWGRNKCREGWGI